MLSNIKAARLLGWASLAVGVTEIVATRLLEKEMGVEDHESLIVAYGIREIAAGLTILKAPGLDRQLAAGLWARVGGDALDIATLCAAATTTRKPAGLASISAIVLGITGLDILVATRVQNELRKAAEVSEAARQRVVPSQAMPNGMAQLVASASTHNSDRTIDQAVANI